MSISTMMTTLPFWATFLIITVIGLLITETGIRAGRRKNQKESESEKDSLGTVVGALLGFLAFMLAFTFSLTESRFSNRKALVIQQANALGTFYLRTSLIPEKQKTEIRKLFREYIDILVDVRSTDIQQKVNRMEEIHSLIWKQTASLTNENMDGELRSLFVESVNQMIDIFGERKTVALVYHIPDVIWICLLLLYTLSMFILGFEFSSRKKRRIIDTPMIAAAFALIVALIADMDSTKRVGNFEVSQQPLIEVQKMVQHQAD
jgi:hypothetical protein